MQFLALVTDEGAGVAENLSNNIKLSHYTARLCLPSVLEGIVSGNMLKTILIFDFLSLCVYRVYNPLMFISHLCNLVMFYCITCDYCGFGPCG